MDLTEVRTGAERGRLAFEIFDVVLMIKFKIQDSIPEPIGKAHSWQPLFFEQAPLPIDNIQMRTTVSRVVAGNALLPIRDALHQPYNERNDPSVNGFELHDHPCGCVEPNLI